MELESDHIHIINGSKKNHFFFHLPDLLEQQLQADGVTLDIHAIHIKNKPRGHEIIFCDKHHKNLTLDEVVDKILRKNTQDKEQNEHTKLALRANLVHALLQNVESEVHSSNGAFSVSLIETISIEQKEKEHPRYFIAPNLERVNPEEYSGRGCAEANVNLAARQSYKGEYLINELHLRCYFKDKEGQPKMEHGKQCLCGVCRDICDGHWNEGSLVYLHPINPNHSYLKVEQQQQFNQLDQEKISCVSSEYLMPELKVAIANQAIAQQAFNAFATSLTNLVQANEPLSTSGFAALRKTRKALEQALEVDLNALFANAPPESHKTIDILTLGEGTFLEKLNRVMVTRLKEAVYAHLLTAAAHGIASDNLSAIPEKIEIVAGFNPKLNTIEVVASCSGETLSALPTASAGLGLANNTKGFSDLAYMVFDKAEFQHRLNKTQEQKPFEHILPKGNFMERANKQKGYTAIERDLHQADAANELDAQETKQRWTIFPLNDGEMGEHALRSVMHQTTIERVLPGGWAGAKATIAQGRS